MSIYLYKRNLLVVAVVLALVQLASACSDSGDSDELPISVDIPADDAGGESSEGVANQATWLIIDNCNDGQDALVNFIEVVDGEKTDQGWPGNDRAYVVIDSKEIVLSCAVDTRICYGAEPADQRSGFWGTGLTGIYSCEGCCIACGAPERGISLEC